LLTLIGVTLVALSSICFSQLFAHVREIYLFAGNPGPAKPAAYVMSLVRACFSLSWTVGPAMAAVMLAHFSFTGLFLCASGLFLAFVIGISCFVPAKAPPAWTSTGAPLSIRRALAQPDMLLCFVGMAAVFAAHALNMLNLPLYLTHELQSTTRDFGITYGIGPLVELPLMLWFGRCATKLGRYRLMLLGIVDTCLYFVLIYLATQPWHVFCAQVLSGVSFAILTNVAITFFQDLRPGQAGLATSVYSTAINTGNLLGYLAFGFVLGADVPRAIPAVGVLLCIVGFGLFLLARRHTTLSD
jgi:SET family sugar efflux transporter-like MFS transporter